MKYFTVLVTGSRKYSSRKAVDDVLADFAKSHWPMRVIVGDCPTGADLYARDWCTENNTPCTVFTADWDKHGRAAGPIRNREMVNQKPDIVLAFFEGESRGTRNCVGLAIARGIEVIKYLTPKS